jgi:hypothetical protein
MDIDTKGALPAPISIRNGPVDDGINGNGKRKSRGSIDNKISYKEESDSDDGPMVCTYVKFKVA